MILPSKHLSQERALLTVGGRILQHLRNPMTISALWEELTLRAKSSSHSTSPLNYDGFVLALDLLYLINAIEMEDGLLATVEAVLGFESTVNNDIEMEDGFLKRNEHDSSYL